MKSRNHRSERSQSFRNPQFSAAQARIATLRSFGMKSSLWLERPAYHCPRMTPKAAQKQKYHLDPSPEMIWRMGREAADALTGWERSTHGSLQKNWISCNGMTTWRMSYKMQVMMSTSVCISLPGFQCLGLMKAQVVPHNYPVTAMDLSAST